jgi:ACS family hexuronate transporter-like MFS transporter
MRDTPEQHSWISEIELALIKGDNAKEVAIDNGPKVKLGQCLKQPLVWIIAFSFFSYSWALNTFLSWFPTYLVNTHHINIHDLAISGSIPWLAGTLGLAIGGIVTDWIGKKTGKTTASRKWLTVICLLGVAAAFFPSALVTSTVGAVTLMAVAVFLLYLTGAQYWAIIAETYPLSHLGGIGGFVNALANLAGIVAPIVTGAFVQSTGSWGAGFIVGAFVLLIGALGLAIFGKVSNKSLLSAPSNSQKM